MHYSLNIIDRLVHVLSPILLLFYHLILDIRHYGQFQHFRV